MKSTNMLIVIKLTLMLYYFELKEALVLDKKRKNSQVNSLSQNQNINQFNFNITNNYLSNFDSLLSNNDNSNTAQLQREYKHNIKLFNLGINDKVAYIFDYLDFCYSNITITEFKNLLSKALILKENNKTNFFTQNDISKIVKSFNWTKGNNFFEIDNIFYKYDLNRNYVLEIKEFLFMSIDYNKRTENKVNPYSSLINNYLKPFFTSCNGNSNKTVLDSETFWNCLKYPECARSRPLYNIFQCNDIHTDSVNEFILYFSNERSDKSYIFNYEFYSGLLIGFLNRYVDMNHIYTNDFLSDSVIRWGNNGLIDLECDVIIEMKNYDKYIN